MSYNYTKADCDFKYCRCGVTENSFSSSLIVCRPLVVLLRTRDGALQSNKFIFLFWRKHILCCPCINALCYTRNEVGITKFDKTMDDLQLLFYKSYV